MKTKRHKKGCYSIYLQQPSDYIISIKKENDYPHVVRLYVLDLKSVL